MTRLLPLLFFVVTALIGCEKTIDFKLEKAAPKLVVEATIENGKPPVVILSRSASFFSTISPELLEESFVRNAEVYISNGTQTHRLIEYEVPAGNGYLVRFYSNNPADPSTEFIGELKTDYFLRIVADGKEYTARTTIPNITRRIDSLWWKPVQNAAHKDDVTVFVRATDPPGFGDYIRYFTRKNSHPFFPPFNSVFDDFVIDGTTYELAIEPGYNRNIGRDDDYHFFRRGDTVTLKLANIDRGTYDFWRTMEYSYGSIGNPFSTPVKVISNISGDALGYFGGYAAQYRTLIIPK